MWTVDHEADIASDLSAFHRVDDPMTIEAARYFSLALRLSAYSGVIGAVAAERQRRDADQPGGGRPAGAAGAGTQSAPRHVSDDVLLSQLRADGWLEKTKKKGSDE